MTNIHDWLNDNPARDEEEERRQRLAQTALDAPEITPDDAAANRRNADAAGVSPLLGDNALTARAAEARRLQQLRETNPRLADWVGQPENYAVARDDVENLARIEGLNSPRPFVPGLNILQGWLGTQSRYKRGQAVTELGRLQNIELSRQLGRGRVSASLRNPARIAELRAQLAQEDTFEAPPVVGIIAEQIPYMMGATEGSARAYGEYLQWYDLNRDRMSVGDTIGAGAESVIEATRGGAEYTAIVEAGNAFDEISQFRTEDGEPIDQEIAARAAHDYGQFSAGIEVVGFGGVVEAARASGVLKTLGRRGLRQLLLRSALARMGVSVASGYAVEGAEEAAQEAGQIGFGERAKAEDGRDFAPLNLSEAGNRVFQSFLIGGVPGGAMAGAPHVPGVIGDLAAISRSQDAQERIEQWSQAAQTSALGDRLPSARRDAVNAMTEGTAIETVRIDADAFVEHFQSQNQNPLVAAHEMGVTPEMLQTALASHGEIAVQAGVFDTQILRTPGNAALAKHARFSAHDFTQAERETIGPQIQKMAEEIVEAAALNDQTDNDIGQAVETRMRELFSVAAEEGGPTAAVSARYARLVSALPRAVLARARASGSPEYAAKLEQSFRTLFGENLDVAGPGREAGVLRAGEQENLHDGAPSVGAIASSGEIHPTATRFGAPEEIQSLRDLVAGNATAEDVLTHPLMERINEHVRASPGTATKQQLADPEFFANREYVSPSGEALDINEAIETLVELYESAAGPEGPAIEKRGVVIMGYPGAGKSTFSTSIATAFRAAVIDADVAKTLIPEYEDGYNTQGVHFESAALRIEAQNAIFAKGENVVMERVGDDPASLIASLEAMQEAGYSVSLVHIKVDADEAVRRSVRRFIGGGRYIEPRMWRHVLGKTDASFETVIEDPRWAGYVEFDANGPRGTASETRKGGETGEELSRSALGGQVAEERVQGDRGSAPSPEGEQSLSQADAKGSIRYQGFDPGQFGSAVIKLGDASDLSTFLHEFGHLGHLILESIATDAAAPAELKAMWDSTLSWWGLDQEQWSALTPEQKTPYFETWARTFEAYLMEGKAPSLSLREAFATFKAWLTQIYRSVLRLDARLTPEIRDVFDRLLATDTEIAEARAAMGSDFALSREAFKSEEEFAQYQGAIAEARDAQEAELRARAMDAYARKSKRWWRGERERMRDAATRAVDSDPARRAEQWIGLQDWRALPDTELSDEGEISYVASANAMEDIPEGLPTMRLSADAIAQDWPNANLPVSLQPRTDVEATLAEAMRLKAQTKGRGAFRAQRLARFIKDNGGLRVADLPEDQRNLFTGVARRRPGLINNESGKSPEEMMRLATEAGYFGEGAAREARGFELPQDRELPDAGGARLESVRFGDLSEADQRSLVQHMRNDPNGVQFLRSRDLLDEKGRATSRTYEALADERLERRRVPLSGLQEEVMAREAPLEYAARQSDLPPILVQNGAIIDGNHRVAAARLRGASDLDAYDASRLYGETQTGRAPGYWTDSTGQLRYDPARNAPDGGSAGARNFGRRAPDEDQVQFYFEGDYDLSHVAPYRAAGPIRDEVSRRIAAREWVMEDVPLDSLRGAQPNVSPTFRDVPAEGFDGKPPIIVRYQGRNYIDNGNHRLVAAAERGDRTARVAVIDLDSQRPNAGTSHPGFELFQDKNAPIFESAVLRTVEASTTQRAPGAQWLATISKAAGVKREEIEWMGLADFLKAQEGPITREEVLSFVRENGVRVEETVLGGSARDEATQRELLPLIEERQRLEDEQQQIIDDAASSPGGIAQGPNRAQKKRLAEMAARMAEIEPRITELEAQANQAKGQTRWSQYTLPGGEAYKELLLRLPEKKEGYRVVEHPEGAYRGFAIQKPDGSYVPTGEGSAGVAAWSNRAGAEATLRGEFGTLADLQGGAFRSSHFDQPNILAHIRFNERTDSNGARTLFIEEVQSDWHQGGRERGYSTGEPASHRSIGKLEEELISIAGRDRVRAAELEREIARQRTILNNRAVPDAPFKNNAWASLAMKRMIRWAAENGFDQIAWTRGQHQIERFSLETHVDSIGWGRRADGTYDLVITRKDGGPAIQRENVNDAGLVELIGQEAAQRIIGDGGRPYNNTKYKDGPYIIATGELSGPDLRTGGGGMRAFYDRILPNIANDLGKKFGARVGETDVGVSKRILPPSANGLQWRVTADDGRLLAEYPTEALAKKYAAGFETVHSLPITPEMREGVTRQAQTLFQDKDKVPTVSEFITTLISDLKNERLVYSARDPNALANAQALADAQEWFDAHGIDLSKDKETIRGQIVAAIEADRNAENAYHPDDIAGFFGFSSGDELVQALSALKPRAVAIEEQIDRLVEEEHGDAGSKEKIEATARAAAHSEVQARRIEMELAALEKATGGRRKPVTAAAKAHAREAIEGLSLREIRNADVFLAGERRAARAAFEAASKGDWPEAARSKSKQLVSFWMHKYATEAAENLTKIEARWRRYSTKATTRAAIGPRHIEQIDAILDTIETGKPSFSPSQSLSEWAADIQENDGVEPEDLSFNPAVVEQTIRRRLSEMDYAEVRAINDVLKNIETIGRSAITLRKGREARRLADIVEGLKSRLRQEWAERLNAKPRSLVARNAVDKTLAGVGAIHGELLKADYIARALDGFQDGGPFMDLLGILPQHAQNDFHERSLAASTQFREIVAAHYTNQQFAQLMGKRLFIQAIDDSRTKMQLIGYALNRGTRYNFEALLKGENWTEQQFWDVVASLDKNDWSFVRALWGYVGQWKEESFALDERVRGVRPVEEIGERFQLPDGSIIQGSYWPVAFDPARSERAAQREARSQTLGEHGAGFALPATSRGRLKGRVGTGGQPLSSDPMAVLTKHVNDTLKDISHRELVIAIRRVKANKELRAMIEAVVGPAQLQALDAWTLRIARKPPLEELHAWGQLPAMVRRSYTNYAMGFKASVAVLNVLGHFQAMPRNGVLAQLKQAGITLVPGFLDLLRRHIAGFATGAVFTENGIEQSGRVAFVRGKSKMMTAYMQGHYDRDLNDLADGLTGKRKGTILPAWFADMFQTFNTYTNQIVGVPTWLAAYESALDGKVKGVKAEDEAAADYADSVVRMVITAGDTKDLSSFTATNNEWVRIAIGMFMNWANIAYNQLFAEQIPGLISGKISRAKFAANMVWIWLIPGALSLAFYGQAEQRDDEDDDEYALRMALSLGFYPLNYIPGVRDATSQWILGYRPQTPIQSAMTRAKLVGDAFADGDNERLAKQAAILAAQVTGVPQQLITVGDYAVDLAQGNEDPAADPLGAMEEALLRDTR